MPAGSVAVSRSARLRDGPALDTLTVTVVWSPPMTSAGADAVTVLSADGGGGGTRKTSISTVAVAVAPWSSVTVAVIVCLPSLSVSAPRVSEAPRAELAVAVRAPDDGVVAQLLVAVARDRREHDRLQARGRRIVRARRRDLDRRRGVGHAHGDAGELRDRAAQPVGGRDREAARGRAGQRLGVDHERLARDAERQRAPRRAVVGREEDRRGRAGRALPGQRDRVAARCWRRRSRRRRRSARARRGGTGDERAVACR